MADSEKEDDARRLARMLAKVLVEGISSKKKQKDYTKVEIGDSIAFKSIEETQYTVEPTTGRLVMKITEDPKKMDKVLITFLNRGEAIYAGSLEEKFPFKCNRCPGTHYADAKIFIPSIQKEFYVAYNDICLKEESDFYTSLAETHKGWTRDSDFNELINKPKSGEGE